MTRGIQLSTSSSSRSTGKKGALNRSDNIINNGSIIAQFENGRTIDEDGRIGSRGGESLAGGSSRGRREMHDDEREDEARSSPSLTRAARYNARTARKSSVHQVPVALNKRRASLDLQSSDCESVDPTIGPSKAASPRSNRKIFFSTTSYSTLVTITIALLAWSMLQTAQAALSCTTDADCSEKGVAKCKQDRMTGASTCVYKSCSSGYWGAGNTYSDCFECPSGMTSLEGKAFYETDCFLPCGDNRCYIPDGGSAECNFEPASATHMCSSSCNDASFSVINANKPYATCIRKAPVAVSSNSTSLTNQANSSTNKRKVVKLFNKSKRSEVEGGRRLKLKKDVDLRHQGPAVALLRDAGRDPLALVSK